MGQRHKHADVIIAWAEGKDVQVWSSVYGRWKDLKSDSPSFFADFEYRIKPPAKKYKVALYKDSFNGNFYTATADIQKDAEFYEKEKDFIRWLTDWIEYEK